MKTAAHTTMVGVLLCLACLSLAMAATKTVPGEKWQQKITVQMQGMSMPMGSTEVCVPVGKASADLFKPDKNCAVSNLRQSGNKFSADIKCTGADAMEGSMEQIIEGNHMTGTARMRSAEGEMQIKMDSVKGGACQAIDTDAMVADARAQVAAAPKVDLCASSLSNLKGKPENASMMAILFLVEGGQCVTRPANAEVCAAIQTRAGFTSLVNAEKTPSADFPSRDLTARSVAACNLGSGKAGVDTLRAKLVSAAEAAGDAGFLEAHAPARLKQIARTECVLKGEMYAGRTAKWDQFCDSNFAEEARH